MEQFDHHASRPTEISLSEEWALLSEAMYGPHFVKELAEFMRHHQVQTLLECGCGGGHVLRVLGEMGFSCLGTDADSGMIRTATQKNTSPNTRFQKLDWRSIGEIEETFDMVMCRGNSLPYITSWGKGRDVEFDAPMMLDLLFESLKNMYGRLRSGGLLYLDTLTLDEIEKGDHDIEIHINDIHLTGYRKFDRKRRRVDTYGKGTVQGRYFNDGGTGFLIYPDEIVAMLTKLEPAKIWTPTLPHEGNYQVICARKQ